MCKRIFKTHLMVFGVMIFIANFAISQNETPSRSEAIFCFFDTDGLNTFIVKDKFSAMVNILNKTGADVIFLANIADKASLEKLQKSLNQYTFAEIIDGNDPNSHLAVLAKIKPVELETLKTETYKIKNRKTKKSDLLKTKRGFISSIFKFNNYSIYVLGAHLKSRDKHELYNQTDMRRYEGRLLRSQVNKIMKKDPNANILVLGNFNDTCGKSTVKGIYNRRFGIPKRLFDIRPLDYYRTSWTHWNHTSDDYERIDYAVCSSSLIPEVNRDKTYILHNENWHKASFHRPIVISIKTKNQEPWSEQQLNKIYPNTIYEAQAGHFIESKKVGKTRKRKSPSKKEDNESNEELDRN